MLTVGKKEQEPTPEQLLMRQAEAVRRARENANRAPALVSRSSQCSRLRDEGHLACRGCKHSCDSKYRT